MIKLNTAKNYNKCENVIKNLIISIITNLNEYFIFFYLYKILFNSVVYLSPLEHKKLSKMKKIKLNKFLLNNSSEFTNKNFIFDNNIADIKLDDINTGINNCDNLNSNIYNDDGNNDFDLSSTFDLNSDFENIFQTLSTNIVCL